VADHEHLRVAVVAGEQLERVLDLEAVAEHVLDLRVDVERARGELRGVGRAHLRAGVDRGELDAEPRQPGAGRDGLPLAARGQLPLCVGLRVVRNRLAMAKKPELLGHAAEPRWSSPRRRARLCVARGCGTARCGGDRPPSA
jgi:hypothetical protein